MEFSHHQQLRISIFKRIILIVTVFLVILAVRNYIYNYPRLYILEAIVSICGMIAYINFDKWAIPSKVDTFMMAFTNIMCCVLLYILYIKGLKTTSYVWLTSIPVLSYMLNGIKKGFILSFVYLSLACIILSIKAYLMTSAFLLNSLLDLVFLITIMWVLAHYYESMHRLSHKLLIQMATKDSLTNLNNRHAFYDYFDRHKGCKIGVILIDLDFFKAINDHYGHDAGDYVLIEVADILRHYQSDNIQAFRVGGEEFLLMSIDLEFKELCALANQVLEDVRTHQYVHEGCLMELTASIGVHLSQSTPCNLTQLMKYADYKLYEAKQTGRNRVVSTLSEGFNLEKYRVC